MNGKRATLFAAQRVLVRSAQPDKSEPIGVICPHPSREVLVAAGLFSTTTPPHQT
jgi:hypothetical protein